ncbi:DUF881 domain-containing protein [Streptomyces netropsis]|uniref:Uncharacterized protein YlxW (UPF0749 family) n=1 Tax=Streptomyces netropsis TaxID=55404 RepID=A0A7W7PFD5_STRNE|nr:DUF881 domain-containing protein [Streptomyces netropsis]MBB4888786.1 uncharacterized protein YlxW (UPF0749 family) [Streptomyces netropsis]GGR12273.1 membrane protein [Streptomyces netropsis]
MSSDDTPEKSGKPEPIEEPEQQRAPEGPSGQADKGDEAEKAPQPDEAAASEKPDKPDEVSRPERPEQPDRSEQPEQPERPEPAPPEDDTPEPVTSAEEPAGAGPLTGRQRLAKGLWPPRLTRAQLIVALLLCVLGLGLAIQVRSTNDSSALRGARQEDLVRILDELDNRTKRLEDEKRRLENQQSELESSSNQAAEARKQTEQKEGQLGVLAGTVAARGPGIQLTVSDTKGKVEADMLLDAIQELRAAGAEAIQINNVRVVADTYFSGAAGRVEIDGKKVSQPYRFKVIGKPQDLEPALNIPGGVVQTLEKEQAGVAVARSEKIIVDALRPAKRPDYARSSSQ